MRSFKLKETLLRKVKLNAYTGYVVTITTYASQTWWPSKGNLEFEKVQHYATKLILGSNINYRNRLVSLIVLPLSIYVEMHDLLFLLSMRNGDYDIEETLDYIPSLGNTRQNQRGEYRLYKSRLMKTDDNFFRRTKVLFNYVSQTYPNFGNERIKCTWRIICRCGNCNITNKIKLN